MEFYDIAGLVKGASTGEGLGNQFLSHIRETQAIVTVLRVFANDDIIHVENSVDPLRDLDIINTELILKDLEAVGKRFVKAEAEARTGKKEAISDRDFFADVQKRLEAGELLSSVKDPQLLVRLQEQMKDLNLLTAKRQIYLLNGKPGEIPAALTDKITALGADYVVADLAGTDAVPELIQKAYAVLNLISFFTTGEDETRAWTITRETKAPQAAGVIHTDFEQKFIRLEVVNCDKLLEAQGWTAAKQKGWVRIEARYSRERTAPFE